MSLNKLPELQIPESLSYIGAFVTMSCNLKCSYCINDPEQANHRSELFPMMNAQSHIGLNPEHWLTALARLPKKVDLPITLCGGEPTIYYNGIGLNYIVEYSDHYFDLLTNMSNMRFFRQLGKNAVKLQRNSGYPSIRVSWHEEEMRRTWGEDAFNELVARCSMLGDHGFTVSSKQSVSDVGIYMVAHPDNHVPVNAHTNDKVAFDTKDFLGIHNGVLYGNYAYKHSTDLVKNGYWNTTLECKCATNELLIDPMGFVWSCHNYMYNSLASGGLKTQFYELQKKDFTFTENYYTLFADCMNVPIGHILDPLLNLTILSKPKYCNRYGECVGCDTKAKRSHFKDGVGVVNNYSSVQITDIQWPEGFDNE